MKDQNFLSIDYGSLGFLINKNQFYSSCYLDQAVPVNSPVPHLNNIYAFGNDDILVFDMHTALQKLFKLTENGNADLLLIAHLEKFSKRIASFFSRIKYKGNAVNNELIGLRIKSDARMISLPIDQLHSLPVSVRSFCKRHGLLACSFPDDDRVDYLIEVDCICGIFIDSALANRKGQKS
jgi:hypothetical protein